MARSLSALDWLLLFEAWLVLFVSGILLRLFSAERLGIPCVAGPGQSLCADGFVRAERLHRLVELAACLHWPLKTCLPRALSLRWMLSRRGIPCNLRIGARRADTEFQAHAWVEVGGQPVRENIAHLAWLQSVTNQQVLT